MKKALKIYTSHLNQRNFFFCYQDVMIAMETKSSNHLYIRLSDAEDCRFSRVNDPKVYLRGLFPVHRFSDDPIEF